MKNISISIVIVNRNGINDLKICLPSIKKQTCKGFEVIIVDNGSTDDSIEFIEKNYLDYKIVKLNKNYGFAKGNNEGIKIAQGKYILTLNNDIELDENFLQNAFDFLEKSEDKLRSINTKMIYYYEREKINTIGIGILKNGNGYNIGKGENINHHNETKEIFGPCAGAAFYKKDILDEIGYFDEEYFAYLEDLDLAIRAKLKGYKSCFLPTAICYHKHGNTSKRFPLKKLYLIERNRLMNLLKYYPIKYILLELFYTINYMVKGLFGKKEKGIKADKNQKKMLLKNIFGILWIMIKARMYILINIILLAKTRSKNNLLLKLD